MPRTSTSRSTLPAKMAERKWKPGQSGNPNGRPVKHWDHALKSIGKDGVKLIDFALSVWQGKADDPKFNTPEHRWKAFEWLADRMWGKSAQVVQFHTPQGDGGKFTFTIEIDRRDDHEDDDGEVIDV